jgi:hypothetical protein
MLERIILPYGYGQTCNQLFQISHWIPVAKELGVPLYFPGFRRYADLFCGTAKQHFPRYPRSAQNVGWPEAFLSKVCSYAAQVPHVSIAPVFKLATLLPGVVTTTCDDSGRNGSIQTTQVIKSPQIAAGHSLWVRGWLFRDQAGLAKHRRSIIDFFSPTPEIEKRVDLCIRLNRGSKQILIGVHLRRGDYSKWAGGKYCYDDTVFCRLMHEMVNLLPESNVRFLLVSNQTVNAKNYDGLDIGFGPGDPAGDLFALASCDYIIGPPSTFTMWASFFGNVPLFMINDPWVPLRLDCFAISC